MRRAPATQLPQQLWTDEIPMSTTAVIGGHHVGLVVSAASPAAEADTGCINHIGQVGLRQQSLQPLRALSSSASTAHWHLPVSPLCGGCRHSPGCHYFSVTKLINCKWYQLMLRLRVRLASLVRIGLHLSIGNQGKISEGIFKGKMSHIRKGNRSGITSVSSCPPNAFHLTPPPSSWHEIR